MFIIYLLLISLTYITYFYILALQFSNLSHFVWNPPTSCSLSNHKIDLFVFSFHIQAQGEYIQPAYSWIFELQDALLWSSDLQWRDRDIVTSWW